MNQDNLKFLQDRLFYLGTEKRLFPELEKSIAEAKPEFKLSYENHYDKDKLSVELHFRKSDTEDMYFLNKYDASLQKPGRESKAHTFYLDHGKGVTMKEAYNLLDGRSVNKDLKNKEGEVKNAWIQLDFTGKLPSGNYKQEQFYQSYGYNLQAELFKLPLPQMHAEKFNQIIDSLEKGNKVQVQLPESVFGGSVSINIQANPKFKTLDIFGEGSYEVSKVEKAALYVAGEERNKLRDESLSATDGMRQDPKIYFAEPSTVQTAKSVEQKVENIVHEPGAEKSIGQSQQKPENAIQNPEGEKSVAQSQKTEATAGVKSKKKDLESLLPRKQTGKKKGLAI